MIPRLTAAQFSFFMGSGRTAPALCACTDEFDKAAGDYVVKLCGALDTRQAGLVNELLASQLAAHFGLASPEPAVIRLENALIELITAAYPERSTALRGSIGLNFGTKHLIGVSTWPVDKAIPEERFVSATEIFAFDALIQNPDRRFGNPNLFTRGDGLFVYDHEAAFSFLFDILPTELPWRVDRQGYMEHHVFLRRLKSKPIELEGFHAGLTRLSDEVLGRMVTEVPPEWDNEGNIARIVRHLSEVRDHADDFAESIRRVLR
jgi:hypothetical protein